MTKRPPQKPQRTPALNRAEIRALARELEREIGYSPEVAWEVARAACPSLLQYAAEWDRDAALDRPHRPSTI